MTDANKRYQSGLEMKSGYYGVGIYNPKKRVNVGGILRNAHVFGADFVTILGQRYGKDGLDVSNATRHVPTWHFDNTAEFMKNIPRHCTTIGIEITDDCDSLERFCHPMQAFYLFGPEDGSIPKTVLNQCQYVVRIPTAGCLNVNVACGIVLYDRLKKLIGRRKI